MKQIIPFKYIWIGIIIIISMLLGFHIISLMTMLYLIPIITICIMFLKSLYTDKKTAIVSIFVCLIGVIALMNIIFPIAAGVIGLLTCLDLWIFEKSELEETCGKFDINNSITSTLGFLGLLIINSSFILVGFAATPSNKLKDSITNHLVIDRKGIVYYDNAKVIKEDIDNQQIDYEKKYRYIRTISCVEKLISSLLQEEAAVVLVEIPRLLHFQQQLAEDEEQQVVVRRLMAQQLVDLVVVVIVMLRQVELLDRVIMELLTAVEEAVLISM